MGNFKVMLFFSMVQRAPVGNGVLLFEASLSHTETPQSAGLLWTSDRLVEEVQPDNTQQSQQTDIHTLGGIRTRNPSKQAATCPRLYLL
jgi:hypothetical protein